MAASAASSTSAPTIAAASDSGNDGSSPVLAVLSRRIRSLRKKYNRIIQMEDALAAGKILNKEQEDVLRSKPVVSALIDEIEKLRAPISSALAAELSSVSASVPVTPSPPPQLTPVGDSEIVDLVTMVYFGLLFDVKSQSEFTATMLTRTHERECCLTYDYVGDDDDGAADLLGGNDLDAISTLGALVTARPPDSSVSHRDALHGCIRHAKLWLSNSEDPIIPSAPVTYKGLREKLKKILSSDYYIMVPEMKATVDVAAAVGHLQIGENSVMMELQDSEKQQQDLPEEKFQKAMDEEAVSRAFEVQLDHQSDESPNMNEVDALNASGDDTQSSKDQEKSEVDIVEPDHQSNMDLRDQHYAPRRSYPNARGAGRSGARRGYANGRGSRGGRGAAYYNGPGHNGPGQVRMGGGYPNARGGQYYDSGYYPRNYYNSRGRGGRSAGNSSNGGGSMYSNHGEPHGSHVASRVELGANA